MSGTKTSQMNPASCPALLLCSLWGWRENSGPVSYTHLDVYKRQALHGDTFGISAFHDFMVFDAVDHREYEANVFAAELLLEDEDVLLQIGRAHV